MRCFLIIFFLGCINLICIAQDDVPDYRSRHESFSKMQEKDLQSDLASFTMAGIDQSLAKLKLESLPVVKYDKHSIVFEGDDIQVSIIAGVFFATQHKLSYSDKYLVKIDNKPFYGSFGKAPQTNVSKVFAVIQGDTVYVPQTALADLYNPSFTYTDAQGKIKTHNNVYLSADKKNIYIYMLNLDDAGGYETTWIIQDKKFVRRVVDFGFSK